MKSLRKGIGSPKDVEIFYDKWSDSYDQTLYNWNYKAPKQSVNILKKFIKKKPRYLLDLACGTGLFVKEYLKTFERLKKINPLIEFSSDFIIAYPGEEEKDFRETLNLIEDVKFINSYSFIFSPRPGTVSDR